MTESIVYRFENGELPKESVSVLEAQELKALVKSFFDDYLSVTEESDSGRIFNPIHISCVRAMKLKPLSDLLDRMKELSGANVDECKILLKNTLKV
jgi:hypothetical protein